MSLVLLSLNAIEEKVVGLLEDATAMKLDLSEDDAAYGLAYITKKLALCSTYLERLSDIEMKLVQIKLAVSKQVANYRGLAKIQEDELKASDEYADVARDARSNWLQKKLELVRQASDDWSNLNKVVCVVREAVASRAQDMKRLNSDVRLHQKLLEARVAGAGGATSPNSFTGSRGAAAGELDI